MAKFMQLAWLEYNTVGHIKVFPWYFWVNPQIELESISFCANS